MDHLFRLSLVMKLLTMGNLFIRSCRSKSIGNVLKYLMTSDNEKFGISERCKIEDYWNFKKIEQKIMTGQDKN